MNKLTFLIILLLLIPLVSAQSQPKQRVAIIPSIGDYDTQSLTLLAKKTEEIAVRTLPSNNFIIIKQDEVIKKIGDSTFFEMCKERSCVGDIAKEVNANYGTRCAIFRIEEKLVLQFELYREDNSPVETFIEYDVKDFSGMLAVLDERLPDAFRKMIPSSSIDVYSPLVQSDIKKEKPTEIEKIVNIGNQIWMAENLNLNIKGSKCYGDKLSNCIKYGRLYDWETAKKACPPGWHLPTNEEWSTLIEFCGDKKITGTCLKSTSGWSDNYDVFKERRVTNKGLDTYGFTALPGGYHNLITGISSIGYIGYWWSASEKGTKNAYGFYMSYDSENANFNSYWQGHFLSVRCIKD